MLSYSQFLLLCLMAVSAVDSIDLDSWYKDETIIKSWYKDEKIIKHAGNYYKYEMLKTDKVVVRLYYETLCYCCAKFHIKRLHKAMDKIGSYIDLKMYPYGNAHRKEENGKVIITCQHGEAECYGNKLHACTIDILKDIPKSESYITCMMNDTLYGNGGSTDKDAEKCGKLMKIDPKPIMECARSQKGEELLEYYGRESEKVKYDGVPFVVINDKEFDLRDDFMKKVCEALKNPPPECKQ